MPYLTRHKGDTHGFYNQTLTNEIFAFSLSVLNMNSHRVAFLMLFITRFLSVSSLPSIFPDVLWKFGYRLETAVVAVDGLHGLATHTERCTTECRGGLQGAMAQRRYHEKQH